MWITAEAKPITTNRPQDYSATGDLLDVLINSTIALQEVTSVIIVGDYGERTKAVFSCSWQDQPLDIVDIDNLQERLSQNRLQELLNNLWVESLLQQEGI